MISTPFHQYTLVFLEDRSLTVAAQIRAPLIQRLPDAPPSLTPERPGCRNEANRQGRHRGVDGHQEERSQFRGRWIPWDRRAGPGGPAQARAPAPLVPRIQERSQFWGKAVPGRELRERGVARDRGQTCGRWGRGK